MADANERYVHPSGDAYLLLHLAVDLSRNYRGRGREKDEGPNVTLAVSDVQNPLGDQPPILGSPVRAAARRMGCLIPKISVSGVEITAIVDEEECLV